jgi:hypothetical protein
MPKRRTPFIGDTQRYMWSPTLNSMGRTYCQCSSSDEIGQLGCLLGFAWVSLLPLSQCRAHRQPFRLTQTNLEVYDMVAHRVLQKVTSWCSLDNCCYRRSLLMEGDCPTSDPQSEHKHEAYLQWFDWLAQSKDGRLSFEWGGCPNSHVVAPKNEQQR